MDVVSDVAISSILLSNRILDFQQGGTAANRVTEAKNLNMAQKAFFP